MSIYNTDKLISLIAHIKKSIPTMVIISHNERTRNCVPADQIWTAVRKNGISHIEL